MYKEDRARITLAKAIQKDIAKTRPVWAGAFVQNGKQCLCDGFEAAIYNDVIAECPAAKAVTEEYVGLGGVSIAELIEQYQSNAMPINIKIDLPELIEKEKAEHAARGKSNDRNGFILIKVGKFYFDAARLIPLLKTLHGDMKFFIDNKDGAIVAKAENGKILLCSMHIPPHDTEGIARLIATYGED